MAEKKKAVIETEVIQRMKPVDYVVVNTQMSPQEFYTFVENLQSAADRADSYTFQKFNMASKRCDEEGNNEEIVWQKNYWYNEWDKMSELKAQLTEWLEEHKTWHPDYKEEEQANEED